MPGFKFEALGIAALISWPHPRQLLRTEVGVINVVFLDVAVVKFYPWFNFYFLLFHTHCHTALPYPKTGLTQKQKKIKFKPRVTIEPQHSSVTLVLDLFQLVVQVLFIFVT